MACVVNVIPCGCSLSASLTGAGGNSFGYVIYPVLKSVVLEGKPVAVETVGLYNVCSSIDIVEVHLSYRPRLRDTEHVIASFERNVVLTEYHSSEIFFCESEFLQIGTCSTIENKYS